MSSDKTTLACCQMQRWLLNFPGTISLPDPLERMGQELRLGITDAVTGIAAKQVLILITFGLEYLGHLVIRFHPVVHVVTHNVWVEQVIITNGNKQADRLLRTLGNDRFVKAPGAIRILGIKWPRLVHEGARGGEYTVVKIRTEPSHD